MIKCKSKVGARESMDGIYHIFTLGGADIFIYSSRLQIYLNPIASIILLA